MGEGAIRLGHAMGVLALLDRRAAIVRSVEQFGRKAIDHGLVVAAARGGDDPADGERLPALGAHFDRHLIGRAADAARAHFDRGGDIVERLAEYRDRIAFDLGLDAVERAIDDRLGDRLLALVHDRVHEFGDDDIAELGVRADLSLFGAVTTRHALLLILDRVRLFRPLGAVFRPALLAILDALRVEDAAENVI